MSTQAVSSSPAVTPVALVGAGPGVPDLLTVRAVQRLEAADVVFFDALVPPEVLAIATGARKVAVGKRSGRFSTDQRFINRCLIEAARQGHRVVRLKGGDPMLFGRAQEEIEALRAAGIPIEVIPGVTAALAASASLQVSLTRRGIARTVALGTPQVGDGEALSDWAKGVADADTIILYMAKSAHADVARALLATGWSVHCPVVVVENACLASEARLFTTLSGLETAPLVMDGPAVMMIGEVYARASAADGKPVGQIPPSEPSPICIGEGAKPKRAFAG